MRHNLQRPQFSVELNNNKKKYQMRIWDWKTLFWNLNVHPVAWTRDRHEVSNRNQINIIEENDLKRQISVLRDDITHYY